MYFTFNSNTYIHFPLGPKLFLQTLPAISSVAIFYRRLTPLKVLIIEIYFRGKKEFGRGREKVTQEMADIFFSLEFLPFSRQKKSKTFFFGIAGGFNFYITYKVEFKSPLCLTYFLSW
jgi:hypothetical protein